LNTLDHYRLRLRVDFSAFPLWKIWKYPNLIIPEALSCIVISAMAGLLIVAYPVLFLDSRVAGKALEIPAGGLSSWVRELLDFVFGHGAFPLPQLLMWIQTLALGLSVLVLGLTVRHGVKEYPAMFNKIDESAYEWRLVRDHPFQTAKARFDRRWAQPTRTEKSSPHENESDLLDQTISASTSHIALDRPGATPHMGRPQVRVGPQYRGSEHPAWCRNCCGDKRAYRGTGHDRPRGGWRSPNSDCRHNAWETRLRRI
jgi:hypothetical protein